MHSRPVLAALVSVLVLAGCSSGSSGAGKATTTVTTAPATTTSVPPTTRSVPKTTVYTPTHLQTTPDAAAAALISAWSTGNRATAATDATPSAVATLFAQPYPGNFIQARGCTAATDNPGTCTYANRQTGSLIQISVTKAGAGWYVSSVTVES